MTESRLNYLRDIVNADYQDRHDMTQMHFTLPDLKYLVEQAEKVKLLKEEVQKLERQLKQ